MKRKLVALCLAGVMAFMATSCGGKDDSSEPAETSAQTVSELTASGERIKARLLYFTTADRKEDRLELLLAYYNPALAKYGVPALSASDFVQNALVDDLFLCDIGGFRISFGTGNEVFNIVIPADEWEEALPYVQAIIDCTSPTAEQAKAQVIPAGDVRLIEEEGLHYKTYLMEEATDEWSYSVNYIVDEDNVFFSASQNYFGIDMPEAYI